MRSLLLICLFALLALTAVSAVDINVDENVSLIELDPSEANHLHTLMSEWPADEIMPLIQYGQADDVTVAPQDTGLIEVSNVAEAATETETETETEGAVESLSESEAEAESDADSDAEFESEFDSEFDAEADADGDSESEVEEAEPALVEVDSDSFTETESTADAVLETEVDQTAEAAADTEVDADAEAEAEEEAKIKAAKSVLESVEKSEDYPAMIAMVEEETVVAPTDSNVVWSDQKVDIEAHTDSEIDPVMEPFKGQSHVVVIPRKAGSSAPIQKLRAQTQIVGEAVFAN